MDYLVATPLFLIAKILFRLKFHSYMLLKPRDGGNPVGARF